MSPKAKLSLPLAICLDLELLDHDNTRRKNVFSLKMLILIKLVIYVIVLQPKWPTKLQYSNIKGWLQSKRQIFKRNLPTNLEKNLLKFFYIFLLDVNFENITFRLYALIIFFILVKFLKDKKINSIVINDLFKFQVLW